MINIYCFIRDESDKLGVRFDAEKLYEEGKDYQASKLPVVVPLPDRAIDIASGCHHFVALTQTGQVYTFGDGSKGQLGRIEAKHLNSISTNRELFMIPGKVDFGPNVQIVRIFSKQWSSFALTAEGTLYAWGLNNYFQLGFETKKSVDLSMNESVDTTFMGEPFPVSVPLDKIDGQVVKVSNGQQHLAVLTDKGYVYTCGNAHYGKLGHGKDFIEEHKNLNYLKQISPEHFDSPVTDLDCGDFCTIAITQSGRLYSWGQGSVHIGSRDNDLFEPHLIDAGLWVQNSVFSSVSVGPQFTLAVGNLKSQPDSNGKSD